MKKYLVIGNPIEHSLSPKLHNFWFKANNINSIYVLLVLRSTVMPVLRVGAMYCRLQTADCRRTCTVQVPVLYSYR